MTKVVAFGNAAERWTSGISPDIPCIAADPSDSARALQAVIDRRIDGEPSYVSVLLEDERTLVAHFLAAQALAQRHDLDERQSLLDQINNGSLKINNGEAQSSLRVIPVTVISTLKSIYEIADSLLVRSWTEYARYQTLFGVTRPTVVRHAFADPIVPPSTGGRQAGDAVVIWAPRRLAHEVTLLAFAFEQMLLPVIVVCAGGDPPPLRAAFVPVSEGVSALRRALAIIDAETFDPGSAIALAAYGVPLAVASTSGAHEYVTPTFVYDPWNWRTVFREGSRALGGVAPRQVSLGVLPPPALPAAQIPANPPLVSVVIPTYNKRTRLEPTLQRWSGQTYPNLEVVLVNDGGEPIDDIAARHPRVRLETLAVNSGIPIAVNHGARAARGEFLIITADDDHFSPDHVAQLVGAMERTGVTVAFTNMAIRYEERQGDDYRTIGHTMMWNVPIDKTAALTWSTFSLQAAMIRREAFFAVGGYDEEVSGGRDYALVIALAVRYDIINVDTTTCLYSWRVDPTSERQRIREREASSLRTIYARHATTRPAIEALRAWSIQNAEAVGSNRYAEPPLRLPT